MTPEPRDFDSCLRLRAHYGGPEARLFASMLLRMYCRWAERAGLPHELVEVVDGAEGGVERATLKLAGEGLRLHLRGEEGVHRLVRIPPGETRRAASFVLVEVTALADDACEASPAAASEQVRTYVLAPSESVTDDRTGRRTEDAQAVLDGDLSAFIPPAAGDRS